MAGYIPKTVFALVQPAVWSLAARLLILTTGRPGSKKKRPTVSTFYETGIITSLYESLLMSPVLNHLEVRHEEPYDNDHGAGAPRRVDLWLRPYNGGRPMLIEAGDFKVSKVRDDLAKLRSINPEATRWFLAFFREGPGASNPQTFINRSFDRANGLNEAWVRADTALITSFDVYRPNEDPDKFGVALLRGV